MKQHIRISVLGIQNAGSEPEAILTKTEGTYCFKNGLHKINYRELDENGTATDNSIFLSAAEMELNKSGSVAAQFLFALNKKTVTEYRTPFGKFVFEVETKKYNLCVKEDSLNVDLKYNLFTNGQLFSENILTIQLQEDSLYATKK